MTIDPNKPEDQTPANDSAPPVSQFVPEFDTEEEQPAADAAAQVEPQEEPSFVSNEDLTDEQKVAIQALMMAAQHNNQMNGQNFESDYDTKITLRQVNDVYWHSGYIDPVAEENIKGIKQTDNGFDFLMSNDKTLSFWQKRVMTSDGPVMVECIGFQKPKSIKSLFTGGPKMEQEDAQHIVAIAKTRGWETLTTTGTEQEREMIWLAAMRGGLAVKDFHPKLQSGVYLQWQKEKDFYNKPEAAVMDGKDAEVTAQQPEAPKAEEPAAEAVSAKAEAAAEVSTAKTVTTSKFANGDVKTEVKVEKQQKVAAKAAKKTLKDRKRQKIS